jgi:hypothetical protein
MDALLAVLQLLLALVEIAARWPKTSAALLAVTVVGYWWLNR